MEKKAKILYIMQFGIGEKQVNAMLIIILHDFDVGLRVLMRVCYPKRSYSPLFNFLSD